MRENKKARPTVGAAEQAGKAAAYVRAAASKSHCTSNPAVGQIFISDYLSAGQENAVPLRHLKEVMGTDGRTARLMIQRERLAGIPILADNQTGYFLPATEEEKQRCVRSMKHRAKEVERVAKAIESAEIQHSHNVEQSATGQVRLEGV